MIGEVELRKEIVEEICKLVKPFLALDDSHVQGRLRFIEIIEKKMKEMTLSTTYDVQVVGLYGVGGIGKSTFCKLLCNYFEEEFCGKVCHVEFGKGTKLDNLHMILRKLGMRTSQHLKDLSEDECGEDLKNLIHCEKIFLAIDNISSDFKVIEEARRYIYNQYARGSIVVVTARALGELTKLQINAIDCLRMPELVQVEALNLFLHHAGCKVVDSKIVEICIQRCNFDRGDGKYHYLPLVLEVLGKHLRGTDPRTWEKKLELNPLREIEHPVFRTLRISFDALLQEDKDIFMDVAIFHTENPVTRMNDEYDIDAHYDNDYHTCSISYEGQSYLGDDSDIDIYDNFGLKNQSHWNVYEWLRVLHYGLSNIGEVKKRLDILKTKSLLEEVDYKRIGMHDLWKEFAIYEIEASERKSRCWVCDHDLNSCRRGVEVKDSILCDGGWERLEKISVRGGFYSGFPRQQITFTECSSVKVLRLNFVTMQEVDLIKLRALKIFELYCSDIQKVSGMGQLKYLQVFIWLEIDQDSIHILEKISSVTSLQILQLGFEGSYQKSKYLGCQLLDIGDLRLLRVVRITGGGFTILRLSCSALRVLDLTRCTELENCLGLGDISSLEVLRLRGCHSLKTLPSLSKLKTLLVFDIECCTKLTTVAGLESMVALQTLRANHCYSLQALPDMSKLINLQRLNVGYSNKLKYIQGMSNLIALQRLNIPGKCMRYSPDSEQLMNLNTVHILGSHGYGDDDEVNKWGKRSGNVEPRQALNLAIFENVLNLHICDKVYTELMNLTKLTRLEHLYICCSSLTKLPAMGSNMRLKSLTVEGNGLRYWDGVHHELDLEIPYINMKLHCIWTLAYLVKLELRVETFVLPDLSCFPQLMELNLYGTNSNFIQATEDGFALQCHDDHVHLKELHFYECPIIELPDLSKFISLETLSLYACYLLTSLTSSKPIRKLNVLGLNCCKNLKVLPAISHMSGLENLSITHCDLEELPHMGNHMRLKSLLVSHCRALRSWDGVGGSKLQDPSTNVELHTLAHLVRLEFRNTFFQLPDLSHFPQLTELTLYEDGPEQSDISGFALQCHTEHLHMKKLSMYKWHIRGVLDLSKFSILEELSVIGCENLTRLTSSKPLATMKELSLTNCENLTELPPISYMRGLNYIQVTNCGVTVTEDECRQELSSGCQCILDYVEFKIG